MSQDLAVQGEKHQALRQFLCQPKVKSNLAQALPEHLSADRMVRIALTAASKQPLLLECSPESVALALMQCSEIGLEPNGRDIHLVPYKNKKLVNGKTVWVYEVQTIVDYKGMIRLAYNSGMVLSCMAKAVRQKDAFKFKLGTNPHLDHIPASDADRGPLTHAWAMAQLKDGGCPFVVLNASEIAEHQRASKTGDEEWGVWKKWPDAMWAKTAFRELSKFIPLSPRLERAIDIDTTNAYDFSNAQMVEQAVSTPKRVASSDVNRLLDGTPLPEAPPYDEYEGEQQQGTLPLEGAWKPDST